LMHSSVIISAMNTSEPKDEYTERLQALGASTGTGHES
jgi:hypothetical protein